VQQIRRAAQRAWNDRPISVATHSSVRLAYRWNREHLLNVVAGIVMPGAVTGYLRNYRFDLKRARSKR
jgi:hypothetical protein